MKQWDYDGRFAVLDIDTLTVTSYPPDGNAIISVALPEDTYILVPDGYGYYRLGDVLVLSSSVKKGNELLIKSISNLLGVPIETTSRSISYWAQYRIWKITNDNQLPLETVDLSEYPVTIMDKRSDGSSIERLDELKMQLYFKDIFWERPVRAEDYMVGVYNASQTPGLASTISRILETIGYRVVEVTNWEGELFNDPCQIRIRSDEVLLHSASVQRMHQITRCPVVEYGSTSKRFDIQLIITHAI